MKKVRTTVIKARLWVSILGVVALASMANAADRIKANNADNLDQTSSWVGGAVPGAGDVAVWDATVTAASSTVLGSDLSWRGIRITDPAGNVTIDGGNALTLGSSGIVASDLLGSRKFNLFNSKVVLAADQEWRFNGWRLAAIGNSTTDEIDTAGHMLTIKDGNEIVKNKITGTGGLTKRGAGQLQLWATQTYTGTTDIQGGELMVGNGYGGGRLHNDSIITGSGAGTLTINKKNGVGMVANNVITGPVNVHIKTGNISFGGISDYSGATTIDAGAWLTVNGVATNTVITVNGADARIAGDGFVGAIGFGDDGGKLEPGNLITGGYATFDTGDVDMTSAGAVSLEIKLGGPTAGFDYNRLRVAGTVNLADADLNISLAAGYTPDATNTFILVDNDEADPIVGTFNGLPEGSTVTLGGVDFTLTYVGGDGNDVILSVPIPPSVEITSSDIAEDADDLIITVGFEGVGADTFALQFKDNLVLGEWSTVATSPVSPVIYTNSGASAAGFYRMAVEQ